MVYLIPCYIRQYLLEKIKSGNPDLIAVTHLVDFRVTLESIHLVCIPHPLTHPSGLLGNTLETILMVSTKD